MKRLLQGGFLIVVVFALLTPVPVATAQKSVRQDPEGPDYLVGFLTWNDGEGAIGWSQAGSVDPGGGGPDTTKDVYESSPIPRTLHINASRLIQIDLFTYGVPSNELQQTSCVVASSVNIWAELRVGTRLVGGSIAGNSMEAFPRSNGYSAPPDPPGYGVCRIRIQAEVATLEQGSVLTLRLTQKGSQKPLYGMAGDHQSVIRIPFFPDEEMPYRYPSYAHGGASSGAGSSVAGVLAGVGLAGLALGVPRAGSGKRRSGLPAMLVLLVATSALAGCASNRSTSLDHGGNGDVAAPTSLAPAYQRGGLSGRGYGALIGQVLASDIGEPVHGALAILVGTDNASRTDPYGRFVFKGLVAGTYHLRVDHHGYQPFEGTVVVVADLTAQVNLTLVPVGSTDTNQRPHVHDYWEEKSERRLMDHESLGAGSSLNVNPVPEPCPLAGVYCERVVEFRIPAPASETEYRSVLPGTYEVNVTLHWDPQSTGIATAGILFQANNDPSLVNWTPLLPRAPAEPFTIATTWEMADPGHQHYSSWTFSIFFGSATTDDEATRASRTAGSYVTSSAFSVTLSIRKGVVPFEPAHQDFWRGQSTATVLEGVLKPTARDVEIDALEAYKYVYWWNIAWFPVRLVPPGTTWVEVFANASRDLTVPYELEFRYKTAASRVPSTRCWGTTEGGIASRCDGPEYLRADQGTVSGRSHRWTFPVQPQDADQFYQVRSFFVFGLEPKPDAATFALMFHDYRSAGEISYALTVIAHRDAMPT